MDTQRLSRRYSPGEDAAPLLRALAGGLIGALLALAIDWLVPSGCAGSSAWTALVASAFGGRVAASTGVAVALVATLSAAVAFAYGQFRRFVPGPPWLAGIVWSGAVWLVVGPMLLPGAAAWEGFAPAANGLPPLLPALGLVAETALGVIVYGAVVGYLNPAHD